MRRPLLLRTLLAIGAGAILAVALVTPDPVGLALAAILGTGALILGT